MTQGVRIERVEAAGADYDQVVELGDANSATLGQLPYAVFEEAAASGCLLAAKLRGEVIGYALFSLRKRRHDVSLKHLCVRSDTRGTGAARRLVEEIVRRHPLRQGIRLRCRVDYAAHHMWPQLGFEEWSRSPGRSHAGHMLAAWWRPIADLPLFGSLAQALAPGDDEDLILAVLDTNVARDVTEDRDEDASRGLMADWVSDHAELVITTQVSREMLESKRLVDSDSSGEQPHGFPELDASVSEVGTRYATLREASDLDAHQDADLRVVAETAAGGATHLVTRDAALLRAADEIERLVGVTVLSPADFLLAMQAESADGFEPQFIKTSDFAIQRSSSVPANAVLARFTNQAWDERAGELRERIADAVGKPDGRLEEVTAAGTPWALAAHCLDGDALRLVVLRSLGDRRAYSVLRQLIHWLRRRAVDEGAARIEVADAVGQTVGRALRDEGFVNSGGLWKVDVSQLVVGCGDALPTDLGVPDVEADQLTPALISRIEMERWPLKLFTGAVPCLVVPVRPSYGRTLLGYREAQMTLVETAPEAATARENAYYMARRPGLSAPARILWWITGGGPEAGVRAMSWLDGVDTGTPERLHRKYSRRGVLDLDQVREAATSSFGGTPTATVLMFSRTDVFDQSVSAERARELGSDIWEQGFAVTTRPVSERTAEALYREGMGLPQPGTDG